MSKLLFIDTETTGLNPELHEMWEFAAIEVDGDEPTTVLNRYHYLVEPLWLEKADPNALRLNRYIERTEGLTLGTAGWVVGEHEYPNAWSDPHAAATVICALLNDATIAGRNPGFDERFIEKFLNDQGLPYLGLHGKEDIVSLAKGSLGFRLRCANQDDDYMSPDVRATIEAALVPGTSSRAALEAAGCPANAAEHTAMGDAEHVFACWKYLRGLPV